MIVDFDALPSLIGRQIGISEWMQIDQRMIDKFADATGDHQWIHVDVGRAKSQMPGGKTIAHGFLVLSLIPSLIRPLLEIRRVGRRINYGCNRVRFVTPVTSCDRIRAQQKMLDVNSKSGGMQLTNEIAVEIEGREKPACIAELITIVYEDRAV